MLRQGVLVGALVGLAMVATARAQSHARVFVGGGRAVLPIAPPQSHVPVHLPAVNCNPIIYRPPILLGWCPWGIVPYVPPIVLVGPGGYFPTGPPLPPPIVAQGIMGVAPLRPPPAAALARVGGQQPADKIRKSDPARANQSITLGDRLFRARNLRKASERYEQALQANPNSAAPRVRLAQIALMRGQYTEAANRFREAQAAEPGWLTNAPDIQAIYGEPGDFAAPIAKLETHLQVHPNDRDAWLVLGAQWYLSGRTRQAADVFQRLTDRAADPTLTAFLDATTPLEPARR